jgi:hypothetical protein
MGICYKDLVASKEFVFKGHLGDGGFMVSSSGFTYSNHIPDQNEKHYDLDLIAGNVVYFQYEPKKKVFNNLIYFYSF